MVQKVTGFKTEDGKVFDTEALALSHEKTLSLGAAVKAALVAMGFEAAMVYPSAPHDDGSVNLLDLLLDNSEALVEALTPPKKERKPRAPRAPVEINKPLTEALDNLGAGLGIGVAIANAGLATAIVEAVETAPVDAAAGDAVEDELNALLGGTEVAASTEVAV